MIKAGLLKFLDNDYVHKYSLVLANKMNGYLNKDGIEKVKLQYGVEIFLLNITKLIFTLIISLLLGVLPKMLITLFSFNIIRFKAFGVHATNAFNCLISSIVVFIIAVYFLNNIHTNNVIVICFFTVFSVVIAVYAPADTEKRPIVGKSIRKKLKLQAIFLTILLMTIAIVVPDTNIKTLIVFGALIEVVTILPLTYKILKKRRNNYERYENIIKR